MSTKTPVDRLEDYRWRNRLSATELSALIGIHKSYYSRIVGGWVAPSPRVAGLIRAATGVRFPTERGARRPQREPPEAVIT